jgi:hypothetical protein
MSSMVARGYRSASATNPREGYWPSIVIAQTPNHKNCHYIKPNRVALKYHNFKKDVDLNVHVTVFNLTIKENEKTSK